MVHSNELVSRVKVIWASCVFQVGPSVTPHLVKNEDVWFLANKAWSLDCCHGNIIGIILYLIWRTLLVPSLNGISEIFLEIFLILWFIFLLKLFVTSSVFKQNLEYLRNERRSFKKNVPFFVTFKGLLNKQTIFYFIGTFKVRNKHSRTSIPGLMSQKLLSP